MLMGTALMGSVAAIAKVGVKSEIPKAIDNIVDNLFFVFFIIKTPFHIIIK